MRTGSTAADLFQLARDLDSLRRDVRALEKDAHALISSISDIRARIDRAAEEARKISEAYASE